MIHNKLLKFTFFLLFIYFIVEKVTSQKEISGIIQQRIDHFNNLNTDTFSQRYYFYIPEGVSESTPYHLLYICPEGPCDGTPNNYVRTYAKQLNATIYTLEHRFYGKSVPYQSMTTDNLSKYLSTNFALADLASFIEIIKTSFSVKKRYNSNIKDHQFIIIGCSYPGALSAWFSLKYPHLISGALSSSGVVNSILEFYTFDLHVQKAAGPFCSQQLIKVTQYMENRKTSEQLLNDFKAPKDMEINDLFLLFADIGAESIQYGYHYELCNSLFGEDEVLYQNFLSYSLNFFYKVFGTTPLDYYNKAIGNDTYDPSVGSNADRSWWWQTCSQLAYFQIAPPNSLPSIRSRRLTLNYFFEKCYKIFGKKILPNTVFTNVDYGSTKVLNITTGKTIFVNGSQDPWIKASVEKDERKLSYVIECENCGHCVSIRGCPSLPSDDGPSDKCTSNGMDQVYRVREQTLQTMKKWFSQN
ncbi:hypothetical protein ABK040_013824 [Willaertia magna]